MKRLLLLFLGLLGIGSLAAQPVTVPLLGPRFKQTRERAEILLGHRNGTFPAPDAHAALFQAPVEMAPAATVASKTPSTEKPVATDETLLNEILAGLTKAKGGGLVLVGDRTVLTYGQKVYREGDIFPVPMRGETVYLRIIRIAPKIVTLALNDAEALWRF